MASIVVNGVPRALDRLPDSPRLMASLPRYRDAYEAIPESKWQDIDLYEVADPPILDQIQNGCVGHGGSTTFSLAWWQSGQDMIEFSPTYLYALINGGRDQGAQIGDLIEAAQKYGVCPASEFPEKEYFARQITQADYAAAANYLLDDAYQIATYEELGSALSEGYAAADSVMVGRTFMSMDKDFRVGVDRGPGNHCVSKGGIRRTSSGIDFLNQNSWGAAFGDRGRFKSGKAHILAQGYYSGVVFRSVKMAPTTHVPMPAA